MEEQQREFLLAALGYYNDDGQHQEF